MFKIIPSIISVPSTQSLVVPAISVTIALFSSNRLFKILLFPTLGFPIITVLIPCFINFPSLLSFNIFSISLVYFFLLNMDLLDFVKN